ncbi:hypothetical protein BC828DRAFT_388828 [Blastocladiella britannica]|nr:hypothetical protein BC828DRAFT_388828 [Blastocladiella britannica]
MISTPIAITSISGSFISRSSDPAFASPSGGVAATFSMTKVDIRADPTLPAYFTLHQAKLQGDEVKPSGAVDLASAHRTRVLLQLSDTEQYLGVDSGRSGRMSEYVAPMPSCVWEFLKLPHNPLAFALSHPGTSTMLFADAKSKGNLTLTPLTPKPPTGACFLLYIPASLSQAVQVQQQTVGVAVRPFIQRAMPYIQAVGAIGGLATAGALVTNIIIQQHTAAAAKATATTSVVPNSGGKQVDGPDQQQQHDGSAAGSSAAGSHGLQDSTAPAGGMDLNLANTAGHDQVQLADGPLPAAVPDHGASPAAADVTTTTASAADAAVVDPAAFSALSIDDPSHVDMSGFDHALAAASSGAGDGWDIGGGAGMDDAAVAQMVSDFGAAGHADGADGVDLNEFGLSHDDDGHFHHVGMDGHDGGHDDGGHGHH